MSVIIPDNIDQIDNLDSIGMIHAPAHEVESHLRSIPHAAPSFTPFDTPCDPRYKAVHTSGKRPLDQVDLIVIHDEEADTSQAAAVYFTNPASGGSAHLCVDDKMCYRCLQNDDIPWGAPGANYHGFHIEQAGYAKWSNVLWSKKHNKTIRRCAFKAAQHCHLFGIEPRWLGHDALSKHRNGITSHRVCSSVFGGTHSDPGPNYPTSLFMTYVKLYYRRGK